MYKNLYPSLSDSVCPYLSVSIYLSLFFKFTFVILLNEGRHSLYLSIHLSVYRLISLYLPLQTLSTQNFEKRAYTI